MKLFQTSQIKNIDAFTIQNEPVPSIDLMERAASTVTDWIVSKYKINKTVKIFAGPGNNGGDAWAVARQLADKGFTNLTIYLLNISDRISEDSEINRTRLTNQKLVKIVEINTETSFPEIQSGDLIIDGLFGSGLSRPLEGLAAKLVRHINKAYAEVISIDIPSGLFGEDNSQNIKENIIKAAFTLTFQFPKLSYFFAENSEFVGDWEIMPIGLHQKIIDTTQSDYHYLTLGEIKRIIKKRGKFSHKGTYGHALLIAGSYGMVGAAVISAQACQRGGVGLVTTHVPRLGLEILQTAVPESLTNVDQSDIIFTEFPVLEKYTAVAVGPGIGMKENSGKALKKLLEVCNKPLVIDADAINILGKKKEWLRLIPKNSILTPHPKEFERIAGECKNSFQRNQKQIELAQELQVYIVLKGAHTAVACPDGTCYYNSTGNPGMATGGSGDVLTGLILSLLAQGYSSFESALAGVFIHGLAGDLAVGEIGEYSLISSDIIKYIGKAFLHIQKNN